MKKINKLLPIALSLSATAVLTPALAGCSIHIDPAELSEFTFEFKKKLDEEYYYAEITGYKAGSSNNMVIPDTIEHNRIIYPITDIGAGAFKNHDTLISCEISDRITAIGAMSFANCDNLKQISYRGTIEQWKKITRITLWHNQCPNLSPKVKCADGECGLDEK